MTVTAIEPRRKAMSALYLDGEFACKLDTQTLLEERISVGCELDDDELSELMQKSDIRRAKEKALWLISYRDHFEKELRDKLLKDFSEYAVDKAIERLNELSLLSDESLAKRYADSLHAKHQSPSTIRYKLIQKGIDRDLCDEIVEELDIDPRAEIEALVEKKFIRSLSDEKGLRRTVAALQRAGYRYGDIKAVLSRYREDVYD